MTSIDHLPSPALRPCAWCATEIPIARRPGRPRLYCHHGCRQRAYEHRHGFSHERSPRALPGQHHGQLDGGPGYEQGGIGVRRRKVHAMRTSVRPEGRRRETLCGLLIAPVPGRHFSRFHPKACRSCVKLAAAHRLRYAVNASNELAMLRALLDEAAERRIAPQGLLAWIDTNRPEDRPLAA